MHGACHTSCMTTSVNLVQLRSGLRVHTESKSEETVVRDKKEEIVRTVKQENGSRVQEYRGLFEMIIGILTACHTQYT